MSDTLVAERVAWQAYRFHCEMAVSPHFDGSSGWCGDEKSHELWREWKRTYEARWVNSSPFYRRSNNVRFGRAS